MNRRRILMLAASIALLSADAPDGNEILARAVGDAGLTSYAVPVHFSVRMHRPISVRAGVDGMIYYKADRAALQITKMPGPLGQFFKSSYMLDLAPQTWPEKYTISSVSSSTSGASPIYVLTGTPKNDPSVDHIVSLVTQQPLAPIAFTWSYKDGSSIALTIANQTVQNFTLPATETISVSMPKYALDATAEYGTYALNVPVSDAVFQGP